MLAPLTTGINPVVVFITDFPFFYNLHNHCPWQLVGGLTFVTHKNKPSFHNY